MTAYRISQAANRSGLTMSALRFYEDQGVLPPAQRSPSGYREYAETDLDRLRFLARARNLGLALDEVRDLLAVWDGGSCATAQARLSGLVTAKIADLDRRMSDLDRLKGDLAQAQAALTGATTSGGCGPDCACMTATRPDKAAVDVPFLTSRPQPAEPLVACTLRTSDLGERIAAWADVQRQGRDHTAVAGGVQIALPAEPALVARVAELVALEQQRCSFLTFTLTISAPGGLLLTATGPEGTLELVQDLLGQAA
jgi:DNA-binding transcriptional MerR regulator